MRFKRMWIQILFFFTDQCFYSHEIYPRHVETHVLAIAEGEADMSGVAYVYERMVE
ncbi:MAG: hypothetical protein ABFQ62_02325 [Patescibacteria group bacterium]